LDSVKVSVGWAGWDDLAFSSEEGSSLNTDAGFGLAVVSLIIIAVGNKVRFTAHSINIAGVSDKALAHDTIEGLVSTAWSAGSEDPEVSFLAIALTISKIAILSAVLIVRALSIDN